MRLIASLFLLLIVMPVTAGGDETYPADWFWGDKARRAKHDALVGKPAPVVELKVAGFFRGEGGKVRGRFEGGTIRLTVLEMDSSFGPKSVP